ncbi:hypothetical protein B0H17DRAFT_1209236 [Mycena rosella]|uniref:Uncharacterized protein n=1 Tax=Mycena rosella TaxID=1033263 RepID=A0AAD7D0C1_MYCRO|nr:hypothetical protein B0H17DRAFT_1209236 [Mycena rosella]
MAQWTHVLGRTLGSISKAKEMFKPYDPTGIPDIMPFPELVLKAGSSTSGSVKTDAFAAKAFQHMPQPQDLVKEACLPALVAAWKQKQCSKKNDTPVADDSEASTEEQDVGGHGALVHGYTKVGWLLVIQKVISNKQTAENTKRKTKQDDAQQSISEPAVLSKLLGLATYTGRDKFRDDHHNDIQEHSKTLPGIMNAGGKFRKAESLLWVKEDQASWEAVAVADEDVDWEEVEAVPEHIRVRETFEKQHAQLVKDSINGMYAWAEKPLKGKTRNPHQVLIDHVATHEDLAKGPLPVFPLSAEALDNISPKTLAQTVTSFLVESYCASFPFTRYAHIIHFTDTTEAAFGSQELPWAAIANVPDEYYDAAQLPLGFSSTGLAELTCAHWYELANTLVLVAGAGTSGFFRKTRRTCSSGTPIVSFNSFSASFASCIAAAASCITVAFSTTAASATAATSAASCTSSNATATCSAASFNAASSAASCTPSNATATSSNTSSTAVSSAAATAWAARAFAGSCQRR